MWMSFKPSVFSSGARVRIQCKFLITNKLYGWDINRGSDTSVLTASPVHQSRPTRGSLRPIGDGRVGTGWTAAVVDCIARRVVVATAGGARRSHLHISSTLKWWADRRNRAFL